MERFWGEKGVTNMELALLMSFIAVFAVVAVGFAGESSFASEERTDLLSESTEEAAAALGYEGYEIIYVEE